MTIATTTTTLSEPVDTAPWAAAASHPRSGVRVVTRSVTTVGTLAVVALASLTLVVALANRLSPRGQLVVFGHPALVVMSGSMAPAINTGDLVVDDAVSASQASRLQAGQIITFRAAPHSSLVFSHRIVRIEHGPAGTVSYVTKGDANDAPDTGTVPAPDVLGVDNTRIPYGGYVLAALRHPGIPVAIGIVLLSILFAAPLWRWANVPNEDATTLGIINRKEQP